MTVEECYLRRFKIYDLCKTCKGTEEYPCYSTRTDVEEDLQVIEEQFANRLEQEIDDWSFESFGMGFK